MSTITFKNGQTYETNAVYGGREIYQASQRDTLDIVIPADKITLEEAKVLWQDSSATSEITVEGSGESSVQLNFTLPVSLTLNQMDGKDVIRMKLAQKSALEIGLEKQAQDIKDNEAALCELAALIDGGDE